MISPKLGVLAHWPIQYHTPLFQHLARRGNVDLDVLFCSDRSYYPTLDPQFGVTVSWNIDLLSGYPSQFLSTVQHPAGFFRRMAKLAQWVTRHDVVVVNGYTSPWMLTAMAICRARRIPYLLRASSHPKGLSSGIRSHLRYGVAQMVVSASSGALSMGQLNEQFYRQHHARHITFAPNSVDDDRFARRSSLRREDLLAKWGLDSSRPVIMFCGKLYPGKRPIDLLAAVKLLSQQVSVLFVGDGLLAQNIRASLKPGDGAVTGFINQLELPAYYHAADIIVLPSELEMWGLVINEAMAAGVLPVVSDRVGAAPDLVQGLGEIYPCGNVEKLASALSRALIRVKEPGTRDQVRQHASRYSLDRTAAGFEQAVWALGGQRQATEGPQLSE